MAETDSFGLPRPITGMFASVYKMHCHDGDWALRCFLHFVPDQAERYAAIAEHLTKHQLSSTLQFDFQERGFRVNGHWFPVLKMQWCDGETLDRFLASRLYDREALEKFLAEWKTVLAAFESAGIAHGDLQHGNVLICAGRIKVVDYDGMYVPSLAGKISNELGHRDYQHPGRTQKHFGPELDNFSAWVIYLSVEILTLDPGVWDQLRGGDDCLIFRQRDFVEPFRSPAFRLLEKHSNPDIRQAASTLRFLLTLAPERIPSLSGRPAVSLDLPGLMAPSEAPLWSDEAEEVESVTSEPGYKGVENSSKNTFDIGPVYHAKKRRRSRMKGGSTVWRPVHYSPYAEPAEEPPLIMSPLAHLVREVSGQLVPGEQPLLSSGSTSPASNSTPPCTFSQISNSRPGAAKAARTRLLKHPVLLVTGALIFSVLCLLIVICLRAQAPMIRALPAPYPEHR